MQICKDCNILMNNVVSFSKDKHEKFYRCPKCRSETKHNPLRNSELDRGEVLYREYQKQRYRNK